LRRLRTLRISVTSNCDLSCVYCDADGVTSKSAACPTAERARGLTADEIGRLARAARLAGVATVRLTGGEPLLRDDLEEVVSRVRGAGIEDVALTTNARRLAARVPGSPSTRARALALSGLERVNVGLPSLDKRTYRAMTGGRLEEALDGLESAFDAQLAPVKVNVVLVRGANDWELEAFVEFARSRPVEVRFIERMPFAGANGLVRACEVRAALRQVLGDGALGDATLTPTAEMYRPRGFAGRIGLIAPVTEPFCGRCDRLRVTSDGKLRACLSEPGGAELAPLLAAGAPAESLAREMLDCFARKPERHSGSFAGPMRGIGG